MKASQLEGSKAKKNLWFQSESKDIMAEKQWSIEEIIEDLRNWEPMFCSESETKWLMNKAADYLEKLKEDTNGRT